MKKLALAILAGLLALTVTPEKAQAAATFVQVAACFPSTATSVFPSAPANGSVVVGMQDITNGSTVGQTFKDSNGVSYSQIINQNLVGSASSVQAWSGVVNGSPTATFTYSTNSRFTCGWNLSGTTNTATAFQGQNASTQSILLSVTAKAGDAVMCEYAEDSGTYSSITASGNTPTIDATAGGFGAFMHFIAAATGTINVTGTSTSGANYNSIGCVDYTSAALSLIQIFIGSW